MHRPYLEVEELAHPLALIESSGISAEELQSLNDWSGELFDRVLQYSAVLLGIGTLTCLTYVTYHVISKLRGNEKNVKMNNFGIALAVLGLFSYSVSFIHYEVRDYSPRKWNHWSRNHETIFYWLYWFNNTSSLLSHWLFNIRYVKSTFRLPLLRKSAEFFNEMLQRIFESREEQFVVFTTGELEEHSTDMIKLKKRQVRQERCANVIEGVLLLLVAGSAYTYAYVGHDKTTDFFFLPMFLLLNITMLIAVMVTRFMIKRTPNLLLNENLVIVHVLLFSATTAVMILQRVNQAHKLQTYAVYKATRSAESYVNYVHAFGLQ